MRQALRNLMIVVLLSPPLLSAQISNGQESAPEVSLKISTATRSVRVGERINVRVELHNTGDRYLLVGNSFAGIYVRNMPYHLVVWLEDSQARKVPDVVMILDCFGGPTSLSPDEFTQALLRNWIVLSPGYFYGTAVEVETASEERDFQPGRYRLRASYSSGRLDYPTMCNSLAWEVEKIQKLPYEAWSGKVFSNSIWIEILPRKPQQKPRRN